MNSDEKLLKSSIKLVKLLDKVADETLPQQIVDVVKLHSKLAVGSAWIPVPGADVVAGAASIWGMYARINGKIGLPFGENVMKSIASGVATNLAGYLAMAGVASALKFIPGLGTIGGAVLMSAGMYALTLTSGYIYLKALCALAEKKQDINIGNISDAVKDVMNNKSEVKEFMNDAKKNYK
jgi:uncharacterized protein (DUF697 family)